MDKEAPQPIEQAVLNVPLPFWIAASLAFGCSSPADLCLEAAQHVSACLGEQAAQAPASCNPSQAAALLALGCAELSPAPDGKADRPVGGLLCHWGWTQYCLNAGPCIEAPAGTSLEVTVHDKWSGAPFSGAGVTLVSPVESGLPDHQEITDEDGTARFDALPCTNYAVEVRSDPNLVIPWQRAAVDVLATPRLYFDLP